MAKLKYKKLVQGSIQKKPKGGLMGQIKKPKKIVHGALAPSAPSAPTQPTTGSTSQQAATPAPAAPAGGAVATPAEPTPAPSSDQPNFNVSSFNPQSGQPDPRDSSYWADLAALQATAQQDYAAQQLEQTYSNIDFTRQQGVDAENQRRNIRNTAEGLIGTGLLRSGAHNRKQAEGVYDYTNLVTGRASDKARSDAQRTAQMKAILTNLGIGEMGLLSDAGGRYADAQATAAANALALQEAQAAAAQPQPSMGPQAGNYDVNKKKKKKK